jgi:predicted ATPase/Tfp pilus assembly protein PilF
MAAEVFVSYCTTDHDRVFPLVARLQEAGVSVWIDEQGVEGAAQRSFQIVEAIEGCRVVLLSLTECAVASDNIVREVALALECSKHIFPLYLEPVKLPNSLRYPLAGIQHLELFHGDAADKFPAILEALIHQGVTVTPPAREAEERPADVAHNLPVELTSFVGREREIAAVRSLLAPVTGRESRVMEAGQSDVRRETRDAQLVTLTGGGGCGKTRLAVRVATDLLTEFPDGVWFVGLETLDGPSLVAQSVAAVLGLREEAGRPLLQTLTDYLRPKTLLLLLDNCEHVVEACAQMASALARACPQLRILATSREALGVGGERVFHVPSLAVPDPREWLKTDGPWLMADPPTHSASTIDHQPSTHGHGPADLLQYEAVQLFVDRCRSVSRTFELSPQNAAAVAQVCHRLDGIPLALELAAARVRLLTVEQIDTRLDDRFRLLTGGSRAALPRQQTLRATIDWSHDLLSEPERILLRRLAVFAGGWTLEAAETVCGAVDSCQLTVVSEGTNSSALSTVNCQLSSDDVLDLLGNLVDKSLVVVDESGAAVRYRLSDTLREYGLERLQEAGEATPLRRAHLGWYLDMAEQAEGELAGTGQGEWLEHLEVEHDNLRAALGRAAELGEAGAGLRLGGALWRFWEIRGYPTEGRQRLEALLAALDNPQGEATHGLLSSPDDRERAAARAKLLNGAGNLAHLQGDFTAARTSHEESLAIRRELDDPSGVATSLNNLGFVALDQGEYEAARALFQECLARFRELEDPSGTAAALGNLAILAQYRGEYADARALEEEALGMRRKVGDRIGVAASLNNLGLIAHELADAERAKKYFQESLALQHELGNKQGIALAFGNMGYVAECQGDFASARAFYEQCLALLRELGDRQSVAHCLSNLGYVAACVEEYATARTLQEESLAVHRELSDKRGAALCLVRLAHAERAQGDTASAAARCRESLALAWELQDKVCLTMGLEELAGLAATQHDAWRAAALFGAAKALREAIGVPHYPIEVPGYERDVAAARSAAEDEATFTTAWGEGRVRPLESVLGEVLAD